MLDKQRDFMKVHFADSNRILELFYLYYKEINDSPTKNNEFCCFIDSVVALKQKIILLNLFVVFLTLKEHANGCRLNKL